MSRTLVVQGKRVIRPGSSGPASIHIQDGVIMAIEKFDSAPAGIELVDAGDSVVMPGLVDTHVHLNEPGRAEWEGFHFGTRAAAAGGVTTLIDMPLNSNPPTTTADGLQAKLEAARHRCWVDAGFWGGVVPGNGDQIEPLIAGGVFGFKCFLVPSGVDEFPPVTEQDLTQVLPVIARNHNVLLVHAELPGPIAAARRTTGSPRSYESYLSSRPRTAENEAIELLIRLSKEFRARVHIVHLSSADVIPALRRARSEGVPITVETCPHYLAFSAEEIPDGATPFKCAPPIREKENREKLWAALAEGVIDFITTDHSPCPTSMKRMESGDFFQAWGGITSLQFGLSSVWTEAQRRGHSLEQVVEWLATRPARMAAVPQKGAIVEGNDADLVVFRPDAAVVWPQVLHHRHKLTPYDGRPLIGVVERTMLRGKTIYDRGEFAASPSGKILYGPLHRLNRAPADEARSAFLRCCGSSKWAALMERRRPYSSLNELVEQADRTWNELSADDWLEAFHAHPQIGETSTSKWSQEEQAGTRSAEAAVLNELAEANRRYYEQFGFIFIICASGKSGAEMLAALRGRLNKDRESELRNAAEQQSLITRLRLLKLVTS